METPYTVCAAVLAYVQDAMISAGRPIGTTADHSDGWAIVAVGGLAADCCPGNLVVAPERVFRTTDPFPNEAFADAVCAGFPIGLDIVVRVDRCTPLWGQDGTAPPIDEQQTAMSEVLQDAAIVWNALVSDGLLGVDQYDDPLWERASVVQTFNVDGCIAVETRLTLGIPASLWC